MSQSASWSECRPDYQVETVRSGLEQAWVGRTIIEVILRRDGLRFPFPENMANVLTGAKVESVRRRAKYLLIDTNNGYVFLSHLGMSGRYTLITSSEVPTYSEHSAGPAHSKFGKLTGFDGRHDHMEFRLMTVQCCYTDPEDSVIADMFERAEEHTTLLEHLGPTA